MTNFWQHENQNETREDGEKLGKKLAHHFFETFGKGDDNYQNMMYYLFVDLIDVGTNNAYLDGQIAGFSKEITKMLAANIFFNGTPER